MNDLMFAVGIDGTELNTGAAAIEARLEESGVRMAEVPKRFAKASAEGFLAAEKAQNEWAQLQIQQAQKEAELREKSAADSAAVFQEQFAQEESLAALQAEEAAAQLAAEEKLAALRKQTAFDRMTDEEKLAVLRHEAGAMLDQINAIEGQSLEKTNLQIGFEQKKNQIFDLNKKIQSEALAAQQEQTEEQEKLNKKGGAFGGVLEGLKKGFKDMGVSLQGAGIGIVFAELVSLGREAINNAQKQRVEYEAMRKPLDANTRSLANFGDALDGLKGVASKSVGFVVSGFTLLGDTVGSIVNRMRGISEAQENIAAQSERDAKAQQAKLEKLKQEQFDTEKVAAARKELAEAQQAAALENIGTAEKLRVLELERVRLVGQIANSAADSVNHAKFEKELVQTQVALRKAQLDLVKEQAEAELAHLKNAAPLAVTTLEKTLGLKKEEAVLSAELTRLEKDSADYKAVQAKLDANAVAQEQLRRETKAKTALTTEEELELERIKLGVSRQSGDLQSATLARAKLIREEKQIEFTIAELMEKKQVEGLAPNEENRLRLLVLQSEALTGQVAAVDGLIEKLKLVPGVLKPINDKIEEQLRHMNAMETRLTSLLGRVRGQSDFTSASDAVLNEIARRDKELIREAKNDPQINSPIGGLAASLQLARASADLQAVQEELARRNSLRNSDYNTALRNYQGDPLHFDQLYQSAQQTKTALETISAQLANSGLFPKNGPIG